MEKEIIEREIKMAKQVLRIFPKEKVKDLWYDERYSIIQKYIDLLEEYDKLQIKYENTERELITRTNKLVKTLEAEYGKNK